MRKMLEYSQLFENGDFCAWFLMMNFPEGIDPESDCTLSEMINENRTFDPEWFDLLTGYDEDTFDANDGYTDSPQTVKLELSGGEEFFIEFHPGDTVYYLGDKRIGCTGPDYVIRKIPFERFCEYTKDMDALGKLLMLPMVGVRESEKNGFVQMLRSVLSALDPGACDVQKVCTCIYENCCEFRTDAAQSDKRAAGSLKVKRAAAFYIDCLVSATLSIVVCSVLISLIAMLNVSGKIAADVTEGCMKWACVVFLALKDIFGNSLGKVLMRLEIISPDRPGERVGVIRLAARNLTMVIWPVEAVLLFAGGMRLGDALLKTDVVEKKG